MRTFVHWFKILPDVTSWVSPEESRKIALQLQKKFGRKREELGISKRSLAKDACLDPKAITFLERGDRTANLTTALQIAAALGMNLDEEIASVLRENESE